MSETERAGQEPKVDPDVWNAWHRWLGRWVFSDEPVPDLYTAFEAGMKAGRELAQQEASA